MEVVDESRSLLPDSNSLDQVVAGTLIAVGIAVLIQRRREVNVVLRASWPIILFFVYCLLSLLWSDFPLWGFKRWFRELGELAMVLIVVTDAQPIAAFKQLVSRVGFVLMPASILMIKYFPSLGRGYTPWGLQMNVGVTTNKNSLGVITLVVALGAVWQILSLLRERKRPNRNRRLLAQGILLFFCMDVLVLAHSATSGACFGLGTGLMIATNLPRIKRSPAAVHVLVAGLLLGASFSLFFGGEAEAAEALGRNADLTGRTEVWAVVIPMAPNPSFGAGFETFWLGPRVEKLKHIFGFINESHNGYIETYVNLGIVGVGLIALILGHGYSRAVRVFRHDPTLGGMLLAYIFAAAAYSISEAGFRMLCPMWFFLLLSVASVNRFLRFSRAPSQLRRKLVKSPSSYETAIPAVRYRPSH
jgi:hypothetical protein